jgi:hypothetical protein
VTSSDLGELIGYAIGIGLPLIGYIATFLYILSTGGKHS